MGAGNEGQRLRPASLVPAKAAIMVVEGIVGGVGTCTGTCRSGRGGFRRRKRWRNRVGFRDPCTHNRLSRITTGV